MADKARSFEELTETERRLHSLVVRESSIDRDRLMFLAGQTSAEAELPSRAGTPWVWRLCTVISTVAAIVMAVALALRPEPRAVRVIEYVDRAGPTPKEEPRAQGPKELRVDATPDIGNGMDSAGDEWAVLSPWDAPPANAGYLRLRQFVLRRGVDALPMPEASNGSLPVESVSYWQESQRLLRRFDAGGDWSSGMFDGECLVNPGENL